MQESRSIIIAEDDSDDRLLLETAFKETGLEVTLVFANNGVDLLNILNNEQSFYP